MTKMKNENLKRLRDEFKAFQTINNETSFGVKMMKMERYVREFERITLDKLLLTHKGLRIDDELALMLGYYYSSSENLKKLNPAEQENSKLIKEYEGLVWKGVPIIDIYKHFKALTERLNKIGEPFLSPEQLQYFIKHVFINKSTVPEKVDINYVKGEKGFVIKRFHDFFVKAYKYSKEDGIQLYIKLLCDNFQEMDENTVKHLFKPNICKRTWN